jgi:hypothetical protein
MEDIHLSSGYTIPYPHTVYFNKTVLCQGETLKIVVSTWKQYAGRKFALRLLAISEGDSEDLMKEPSLMIARHDNYYYRFVKETPTNSDRLKPGSYLAQIYLIPIEENNERVEPHFIAEHYFQVIQYEEYVTGIKESFGGDWDDPVYLDSPEIKQLNDFFLSWGYYPFSEYEIALRDQTPRSYSDGRGHAIGGISTETFEGVLVKKIYSHITSSMSVESSKPFKLAETGNVGDKLPHIDLTKYFWMLYVLGSAWTDVLFFSKTVWLNISASEESLFLSFTPSEYKIEGDSEVEKIMPLEEPLIFQIVRETLSDSLNIQLLYDAEKGINIIINANRSFLSMTAG